MEPENENTSTQRNGIYIIDLQKSVGKVDEAYKAVSDIATDGGSILFRRYKRSRLRMQYRPRLTDVECTM